MREISYFAYSFFKIIVLQRAHAQHTRHQSKRTGVGGGGYGAPKKLTKVGCWCGTHQNLDTKVC